MRPRLMDGSELLGVALMDSAGHGEVGVHPDEHAAAEGAVAQLAAHHRERLLVLTEDRIEELGVVDGEERAVERCAIVVGEFEWLRQ